MFDVSVMVPYSWYQWILEIDSIRTIACTSPCGPNYH